MVSVPGDDCCEELSTFGSTLWSAVLLPSTMLGQPDAAGDVLSRSFSALMASNLQNVDNTGDISYQKMTQ